ncbi:hypothetical protein LNV09_24555 [Paucibacter sp. B2R-40]|uniref:hypothetical protein n=1 Tax=Paucibacter sp. B2R-40 TaxID=2893554 RepID=UPI0021E426C1|nr:hypothetical protein [Paucibacter sp. B2R-40]MCV2357324.1 hypothetical protein [Paucibacter sp. B2R-40]
MPKLPRLKMAVLALSSLGLHGAAQAWVYPEHRDIGLLALHKLDPERKSQFESLWLEARVGHEARLCMQPADTSQGLAPACLDWAALPAIAGDHSCSSKDMLANALKTDWILQVADVAAQLKVDLGRVAVQARPEQGLHAKNLVGDIKRQVEHEALRAERINALRTSDTRLQRADVEYATRAGSNNAHFLLPRPQTDMGPKEYGELALKPGAQSNALGVYLWFHMSALQKATRLAQEKLLPAQREELAIAILADEAFAVHFLQDAFAAGHIAGAWGDVSQRKGTHDYYNETGLEVFTWQGGSESMVLMGDAHMRPADAERAAKAVRISLEQVIDQASRGKANANFVPLPHIALAKAEADDFDVCKSDVFVQRAQGLRAPPEALAMFADVFGPTPIPGLGEGLGAMPRFRAEVGPFFGFVGATDLRRVEGGHDPSVTSNGFIGGADLSLRAGFGLDGVVGESGDGLVFGSIGLHGDSRSTHTRQALSAALDAVGGAAAIGSRFAVSTRFRMPFYLVPGDLLLMAPLYLLAPTSYTNMAVTAGNGGLIPWQSAWSTAIGRFQLVLGRELGATFYGYGFQNSTIVPSAGRGLEPRVVNFKSINFELPILEYRPYRAFDTRQSSAMLVQFYAGAEVPQRTTVSWPLGAPGVKLETIYSLGVRLIFDWRRYF